MYKHFQAEFQSGRFKIAGSPNARKTKVFREFREQFLGLQKKHSGAGYLVVNKNPRKKNAKDDLADGTVLCLDAAREYLSSAVEIDENTLIGQNVDRIKSVGLSRQRHGLGRGIIGKTRR
jgi:hypothetical protein